MKILYLYILLWATLFSTDVRADPSTDLLEKLHREYRSTPKVSIIELISNPSTFNGKKVLVSGFLKIEMEGDALYLHEEDFKHRLYRNGISLALSELLYKRTTCRGDSYVELVGVFKLEPESEFKVFSGHLKNISYCSQLN